MASCFFQNFCRLMQPLGGMKIVLRNRERSFASVQLMGQFVILQIMIQIVHMLIRSGME
jgi:hypothetical protein